MRISVPEVMQKIQQMQKVIHSQTGEMYRLLGAIDDLASEDVLEGEAYSSAKSYFSDYHQPIARGFIMAQEFFMEESEECLRLLGNLGMDVQVDTSAMYAQIDDMNAVINQMIHIVVDFSPQIMHVLHDIQQDVQKLDGLCIRAERFHFSSAHLFCETMDILLKVRTGIEQLGTSCYNGVSHSFQPSVTNHSWAKMLNKRWENSSSYGHLNQAFWSHQGYFTAGWWRDPVKLAQVMDIMEQEGIRRGGHDFELMMQDFHPGMLPARVGGMLGVLMHATQGSDDEEMLRRLHLPVKQLKEPGDLSILLNNTQGNVVAVSPGIGVDIVGWVKELITSAEGMVGAVTDAALGGEAAWSAVLVMGGVVIVGLARTSDGRRTLSVIIGGYHGEEYSELQEVGLEVVIDKVNSLFNN